jgi:hypothetical protein
MMFAVMQPLQPQIQPESPRDCGHNGEAILLVRYSVDRGTGYRGSALAWNGVLVSAGTPKLIITRLNTEINAISRALDVVQKMHGLASERWWSTPRNSAI